MVAEERDGERREGLARGGGCGYSMLWGVIEEAVVSH
jgi:hypothetical protein